MTDTTLTKILVLLAIGVFAFLIRDLIVNKAKARNILGLIAFAIFTLFLISGIRSGGIGFSPFTYTVILNPVGATIGNYLSDTNAYLITLVAGGLIYYLVGELFSVLSKKSKLGSSFLVILIFLAIIIGAVVLFSMLGKGLM